MKDIKNYLIDESSNIEYDSFEDFISDEKHEAILFHALCYAVEHINDKDWPDKYIGPENNKLTYTAKEAEDALETMIELLS